MTTTMIFKHETETYTTALNTIRPVLLKLTIKYTKEGTYIKISGRKNPLPFKEAYNLCFVCDITNWLKKFGYQKIAEFFE